MWEKEEERDKKTCGDTSMGEEVRKVERKGERGKEWRKAETKVREERRIIEIRKKEEKMQKENGKTEGGSGKKKKKGKSKDGGG